MSDEARSAATPSARTLHWFGDKSREELLLEIDRIITTDKPALAKLYERLDELEQRLKAACEPCAECGHIDWRELDDILETA